MFIAAFFLDNTRSSRLRISRQRGTLSSGRRKQSRLHLALYRCSTFKAPLRPQHTTKQNKQKTEQVTTEGPLPTPYTSMSGAQQNLNGQKKADWKAESSRMISCA